MRMDGSPRVRPGRRSDRRGALVAIARRAAVVALAATAALVVLLATLIMSGRLKVVITHGVSMQPLYYQGDLIVVAREASYHVGQIVAYRVPSRHLVVLHRLVSGPGGYYTFKGDNNQSRDPWHPSRTQLLGRAVLHIPQGGLWLERATSPLAIGVLALLLLAGGGRTVGRRRRRRRMAAHARRTRRTRVGAPGSIALLPASWRVFATTLAVATAAGIALAGLAWTRPSTQDSIAMTHQQRSMDFSYSAQVRPSAAYSGLTARAPDPVFRKVANLVEVQFRYTGPPGKVTAEAQLSAPSGWHANFPLAARASAGGDPSSYSVTLDLHALDARASAAAAATGMPTVPMTVAVVPTVSDGPTGKAFAPALRLSLSPLQLSLVGDAHSLHVSDSVPFATHVLRTSRLRVLAREISLPALRAISLTLVGAGVLGAMLLLAIARGMRRPTAAVAVRRRYGIRVVEVEALTAAASQTVVEVNAVHDLVQIATQLGLPVLHWIQHGVDTFAVHDEFVIYRTIAVPRTAATDVSDILSQPAAGSPQAQA